MDLSWNGATQSDHPSATQFNPQAEKLLSLISVHVDSFAVHECGTAVAPYHSASDQVTILYVTSGRGALRWADGEIALSEGMIVLLPSMLAAIVQGCDDAQGHGETCCPRQDLLADSSKDLIFAAVLVASNSGHGLGYFERVECPLIEPAKDTLLGHIFSGILAEMAAPRIFSKCIVESLMKQVLIVFLRRSLEEQGGATPLYLTIADPRMVRVIDKVTNDHSERLSIASLAKLVGMTSLGLANEFESVFGQRLFDYIHGVRLHQATNLLIETDLPIKSIAASVGFASRSHFSRAFRKHRGKDPTAFRKNATDLMAKRKIRIDPIGAAKL